MTHINMEIKARCNNPDKIKEILKLNNSKSEGVDRQIDTYFKVNNGRLKIRQGDIENCLIGYNRNNEEGPKQSDVFLVELDLGNLVKLAETLTNSLGILVIVDKKREIYFIDNVKFHIDDVKDLGNFVEIEASDYNGSIKKERLEEQCNHYMKLFGIKEEDLISVSYSDMLLKIYPK